LNQTRKPDEIIVCDDASTDGSWNLIQQYVKNNDIVFAIRNSSNQGIPRTRNNLIQARNKDSDFMVILDADDVAHASRIEKQSDFLLENKEYGLVGSDIIIINGEGKKVGVREYPHSDRAIRKTILHFNPIAQSSVMVSSEVLNTVGVYDERLSRVQDYDLWIRIARAGYMVANIPEALTSFRRHKGQGKETMAQKSVYYSLRVRSRYLFTRQFFSFKGLALWHAYLFAMITPRRALNNVYTKLFVKK